MGAQIKITIILCHKFILGKLIFSLTKGYKLRANLIIGLLQLTNKKLIFVCVIFGEERLLRYYDCVNFLESLFDIFVKVLYRKE